MGVKVGDLVGLQVVRDDRVVVKFAESGLCRRFLDQYEDKVVGLSNGLGSVTVANLSVEYTYVSIKNAPFEMSEDLLRRALARYGRVDSIRVCRYTAGDVKGLGNGYRTAKMVLPENVPSSLTLAGFTVCFSYRGQTRTWFKCGHLAAACDTLIYDRINVFHEADFPPLPEREDVSVVDGTPCERTDVVMGAAPVFGSDLLKHPCG
ncbi:uncharacterized protein [Procambarus clarkii]|uniref:uncharacterized protein n=1 Tax=Procambarus clarkii TaxID=6728 RepID=UPI00374478E2